MKNFVQHGKTIETTAGAAIASGAIVVVGTTAGVSAGKYATGDAVTVNLEGVYTLPKVASGAIAQGAKCYHVSGEITGTASTNVFVGYAHTAAADGATVINVLLAR